MATTVEPTLPTSSTDTPALGGDAPLLTPQRTRMFAIGGGVLAVLIFGAWFAITAGKRKEAFAAKDLEAARIVAEQGNLPQAVSLYEKVASTYGGTSAGYQASLGVAQARLVAGQNELAIAFLGDFLKGNPPAEFAAPAHSLLGQAYENTSRWTEAAASYQKAVDQNTTEYLKVQSMLDLGRAQRLAKDTAGATATYRAIIAKYPEATGLTEARVRLAEMTGGKM